MIQLLDHSLIFNKKKHGSEQFRAMFLRYGLMVEQVYGDIALSDYDEDHPSMILYGHKQR